MDLPNTMDFTGSFFPFGLAFDVLHFTVPIQEISKNTDKNERKSSSHMQNFLKATKKLWTKPLTSNICVHLVYFYVQFSGDKWQPQ